MVEKLETLEVRWFRPGAVTPAAEGWLRQGEWPLERQPARTDIYLGRSGSDSLGVKWREGRFEIKQRGQAYGPVQFGRQVRGRVERWRKWSLLLVEGEGLPLATEQGWLTLHKERMLARFEADSTGDVTPATYQERPAQGCELELTEIRLDERTWWTVALEAFGPGERLHELLAQTAARVFRGKTLPRLDLSCSFGYPRWLALVQEEMGDGPGAGEPRN